MARVSTQAATNTVINKVFDILEVLGEAVEGRSVSELTTILGLPIATVHRLLQQLAQRGYVEQDTTSKRYYLGLSVLTLRGGAILSLKIVPRLRSLMRDTMQETQQLTQLWVYRAGQVVQVDRVETANSASHFFPLGNQVPAHRSAPGRIFLAELTHEALEAYLARTDLEAQTEYSLTTPESIREELQQIARQGYAIANEEERLGLWTIAAPVCNSTGKSVAALAIAIKDVKPDPEDFARLIRIIVHNAQLMSSTLSLQPHEVQFSIDWQILG